MLKLKRGALVNEYCWNRRGVLPIDYIKLRLGAMPAAGWAYRQFGDWNPTKRETHNFHPLQIRENIGSSLLANQRGT